MLARVLEGMPAGLGGVAGVRSRIAELHSKIGPDTYFEGGVGPRAIFEEDSEMLGEMFMGNATNVKRRLAQHFTDTAREIEQLAAAPSVGELSGAHLHKTAEHVRHMARVVERASRPTTPIDEAVLPFAGVHGSTPPFSNRLGLAGMGHAKVALAHLGAADHLIAGKPAPGPGIDSNSGAVLVRMRASAGIARAELSTKMGFFRDKDLEWGLAQRPYTGQGSTDYDQEIARNVIARASSSLFESAAERTVYDAFASGPPRLNDPFIDAARAEARALATSLRARTGSLADARQGVDRLVNQLEARAREHF